jgi:hypothetical protein
LRTRGNVCLKLGTRSPEVYPFTPFAGLIDGSDTAVAENLIGALVEISTSVDTGKPAIRGNYFLVSTYGRFSGVRRGSRRFRKPRLGGAPVQVSGNEANSAPSGCVATTCSRSRCSSARCGQRSSRNATNVVVRQRINVEVKRNTVSKIPLGDGSVASLHLQPAFVLRPRTATSGFRWCRVTLGRQTTRH